MLPKTSFYVNRYEVQTKQMCFLIEDDDVLKKFNTIWDKVTADIKRKVETEHVYNKEF